MKAIALLLLFIIHAVALAPPSLREIKIKVYIPYGLKFIEVTGNNKDAVFQYAYETIILLDLKPASVMFTIKPQTVDNMMEGFRLGSELLKAL